MANKQSRIIFVFLLSAIFSFYKTTHFAFALGEITPISAAITQEETEAQEEEGEIIQEEEENELNSAAGEDIAVQTGTIDPTVPFDGTSLADNLVDLGTQTATTTISTSTNTSQTTTQTSNTAGETVSPVTETATETVGGTTAQVSGEENVTVGTGDTTVTANAGATQTVTTEDLNQQPKESSLIDKVVGIFTGGNEESTTNATGGVQVSSGETQVGTEATADLGLGGGEPTGTVAESTQTIADTTNAAAQPPTQTASETETQPTSQNETSETTATVKSGAPASDSTPSSKHDEVVSKPQSEKTKDQRSVLEQIGSKLFGKASLSGNDQRPALSNAKQGVSGEDCADTGGENGTTATNCTENKSR